MKKVNLIMTMLVMLTGVLTTNAQVDTSIVYDTYVYADISDWTVIGSDGGSLNDNTSDGTLSFVLNHTLQPYIYGSTSLEQSFDLSVYDSIKVDFSLLYQGGSLSNGNHDYSFSVLVSNDGGVTYTNIQTFDVSTDTTSSVTVDNSSLLDVNSKIKLEFYIESLLGIYEATTIALTNVAIEGYKTSTNVGINENDLSDNLEVYSYNKSVFLTSNENINTTVTVYNMNGQVVKTENMNLSTSKSVLNLYDMNSGMYIVTVSDGTSIMRKKLIID